MVKILILPSSHDGQKIKFHAYQQGLRTNKLKHAGGQRSTSLALKNNFISFM